MCKFRVPGGNLSIYIVKSSNGVSREVIAIFSEVIGNSNGIERAPTKEMMT